MPEDYEYDVFFSYRREKLIEDWIVQVVQRLELWLTQELGGRPATIFFDRDSVDVGDRWPDKLREALRASRCMVCIWSPSYFQSRWCVSEWRSFLERERSLGLDTHGLIAPVKFHDGEYFPPEAASVQWADFSLYTATVRAFWDSQRAVEFDPILKGFAQSVAAVVRRAPPFRPDWPAVEAEPLPPPAVALRRL